MLLGINEIDYTKYPTKEFQWSWLRIYLSVLRDIQIVCDRDIHNLYVQVNQFALASHLFWGIWALIQSEHSFIKFDFIK